MESGDMLTNDAALDDDTELGEGMEPAKDTELGEGMEPAKGTEFGEGTELGEGVGLGEDVALDENAAFGEDVAPGEGTDFGEDATLDEDVVGSDSVEQEYSEERMKAILEGVLFTMGRSVSKDDLALALKTSPARAVEIAEALKKDYEASERGLSIIRLDNSFQMCTKEFCFEPLVRVAAHPKKPVLTEVVLETLSIIAYRQPVTKMEISKIRGVSSDHAVNKLVEYGLVAEQGRLNAPGRPILFGTTEEFLRQFRMETLEDLPIPAPDRIAEIQNEVAQEYPEPETAQPPQPKRPGTADHADTSDVPV